MTSTKSYIVLAVRRTIDSFYLGNDLSAKQVSKENAQTAPLRQGARLVMVYLLIPLILLICGADLSWWQAWLYSILILGAGIGGRMWAEQRHPGLTAERQNIENIQILYIN